jgi:hypothetical protein
MYEDVKKHDDKLNDIDQVVDWELFHPILSQSYKNKTKKGWKT